MMKRFAAYAIVAQAILASPWLLCSANAETDSAVSKPPPPNILWLTSEDNGPQLGCYGDEYAITPNLDALAQRSLRYKMCWSNAPVCAPARTTLISGMYATSIGGQHMRSGVRVPEGMQFYPNVLRSAGYFCTNNSKTDYNVVGSPNQVGWNENGKQAHFRNRPDAEQPFFSIFNFTISHESQIRNEHTLSHNPDDAPVPAYQPNVPIVRRDWAQYYDRLTEMDAQVGKVLKQLEKDGLADSTIVFYYGDHGSGMPRSKRWPYNSGLHVPFILHVPDAYKEMAPADYLPGGLSDRLVSFVDMGPTAISLAGADVPENMQGVPFAGKSNGPAKELLFGYRGRMDERIDMVRSCTDGRFVYIRHFHPERIYFAHIAYMFQTPTTNVWKKMFDAGELNEIQSKVWQVKPLEELFDLEADPDEVNNLVNDPGQAKRLASMRSAVRDWMIQTQDLGVVPEAEMHRLADKTAPRTWATSGDLNFEALVNAAWTATENWNTCVDVSVVRLKTLCESSSSIARYWGVRGIGLAMVSPNVTLTADQKIQLRSLVTERFEDDESPIVRVAACEGLLLAGDQASKDAARAFLLKACNVDVEGHFVAMAALNLIDTHRHSLGWDVQPAMKNLPTKGLKPPFRAEKYVGNLVQYLLAN